MPGRGVQHLPWSRIPKDWDPIWFRDVIRDVLAFADTRNALEGAGITITGEPNEPATISTSEDLQNLLLQQFVVASPSGFLSFERVLAGESGVIAINDGGANGNITVSIEDHGINLGKLLELSGAGILGNPVAAVGAVQNISPEVALSVLHYDGTGLVFDLIDHTYVSDFNEAAQDAVGGTLTDSTSIDFTYDDGAGTLTANVIDAYIKSITVSRYVRGASWYSASGVDAGTANIVYVRVPVTGTIAKATLLTAGGSGSCVVDVRAGTFAAFPTVASIAAAAKPTISSGIKYEDAALTGWTTAVTAGSILALVLESSSTFTQISIELEIQV